MGDDACTSFCAIPSVARAVAHPPPQQRICRLDFFGKKNLPKTMNMHLMATNPSSKSDDGTNKDDEANAGDAGGADKDRVGGTGRCWRT
jgi:hypothetical protein